MHVTLLPRAGTTAVLADQLMPLNSQLRAARRLWFLDQLSAGGVVLSFTAAPDAKQAAYRRRPRGVAGHWAARQPRRPGHKSESWVSVRVIHGDHETRNVRRRPVWRRGRLGARPRLRAGEIGCPSVTHRSQPWPRTVVGETSTGARGQRPSTGIGSAEIAEAGGSSPPRPTIVDVSRTGRDGRRNVGGWPPGSRLESRRPSPS
jgi:hypothetical protein